MNSQGILKLYYNQKSPKNGLREEYLYAFKYFQWYSDEAGPEINFFLKAPTGD